MAPKPLARLDPIPLLPTPAERAEAALAAARALNRRRAPGRFPLRARWSWVLKLNYPSVATNRVNPGQRMRVKMRSTPCTTRKGCRQAIKRWVNQHSQMVRVVAFKPLHTGRFGPPVVIWSRERLAEYAHHTQMLRATRAAELRAKIAADRCDPIDILSIPDNREPGSDPNRFQ